jgi:ribosomal protein S18 acetylase RimI-like enzyme
MTIRNYTPADAPALFALLEREGDAWSDYHGTDGRDKFTAALETCIVFIAFDGETACGYVRARDDGGFGVYVYDLLVDKAYRGAGLGRKLLEVVRSDYTVTEIYIMSDVDGYYEKQGFRRIGSVFQMGGTNVYEPQ